MCLCLCSPIYTSKPLKCSLADRSGQARKLSFRFFFVCLEVILAAGRDTQSVHSSVIRLRQGSKGWSGAELFQFTPGLIWSWRWRGCHSAVSSHGLAPRGLVWLCLCGQQHPVPVCGRGSEQTPMDTSLRVCFSHRPENTSH